MTGTAVLSMRSIQMPTRAFPLLLVVLSLAACERQRPDPQPTDAASSEQLPPVRVIAAPQAQSTTAATQLPKLDVAALNERKDPGRVLRFYAAALHARDWAAAARAWGAGSGVTAATLEATYDGREAPVLDVGKGEQEGAAGSLYYEAPVVLRFSNGAPVNGVVTLRRVNDIDGATPEQLRWHIERATIGRPTETRRDPRPG